MGRCAGHTDPSRRLRACLASSSSNRWHGRYPGGVPAAPPRSCLDTRARNAPASNSIGHQVAEGAKGTLPDLIHFYDEQLSHYIWYLAVALLPGYLLLVMWRDRGLASPERPFAVLPAALLFGLVLGISSIEAAVVPMVLPVFVLTALLGVYLYRSASQLRGVELFAFTEASVLVALAVLLAWGAYYGGWPEPSDVGLI